MYMFMVYVHKLGITSTLVEYTLASVYKYE